jgi:hypothetical protein
LSLLLGVGVALDLAALATFKYAGFFETTLNTLFHVKLPVLTLGLPLAISFYTFLRRDLPLPCTISLSASFSEAGASQAYSLVDKLLKEPDPREPRWAFFPIAGADLFTYDGGHLTGASQQTASQRLGAALVDAGIVEGLKGSPR